jgi:hypothetical protein
MYEHIKNKRLLNHCLLKKQISELKKIYGHQNIILSPQKNILIVKGFLLPPGYILQKTDVIMLIPDCYGYGLPVLDMFIVGYKKMPHLYPLEDYLCRTPSSTLKKIMNFLYHNLRTTERINALLLKIISGGKLNRRLYWVCLHQQNLIPCTLLEQLSILYLALEKINKDECYRRQLAVMRTNYIQILEIKKKRVKKIKAEMLYRFPFPDIKDTY